MPNTLHSRVLEFLLKYRQSNSSFKFWLRQRDKNNRLTDGLWFQGTEGYTFVGLYNRGGGTNMTRSFGIIFWEADDGSLAANIQIVWNEEKDKKIIAFYLKAIDLLGDFSKETTTKYLKYLAPNNAEVAVLNFLKNDKPKVDALIKEMGLSELLFLDENQFNAQLSKVLSIKGIDNETQPNSITMSLNTILYGPPGTGKTYNTINKAVAITNPDFVAKDREELKKEYQRLREEGQIVFTTFHQSLGYEDFIEGIKPVLLQPEDEAEGVETILPGTANAIANTINYKIEPGIFFTLCERARYRPDVQIKRFQISEDQFKKAQLFKISLGNTLRSEDNEIYDYCMENNCIALGWGGLNNFSNLNESETKALAKDKGEGDFATSCISKFIHYVKKGNYVLISKGNYICRAIGRITGDYYFKQTDEIDYCQFRNVEWLVKDVAIPVSEIYNKSFSQQSIYKLDHQKIKREFFVKSEEEIKKEIAAKPKNYVMIIDEINRGNVSQIFGELITLIEDDKREGCPEALDVTLPYSKKAFRFPQPSYSRYDEYGRQEC
ncbi:hypothetical protein [Mucilaginibacter antarcticus]|uniref:hypothetical protein n=1 Tax=Mucilaginibacter antarcticus TaxID=1855725 RepID=UPI00362B4D28